MKILIGDIFGSSMKTLVNTVNCVGVMGKGVALEFKKRYPDMFREYEARCKDKEVRPGKPYLYNDLTGISILLFPTKDHWRSPSKLEYIVQGLDWFVNHYEELRIDSIAFPPLGCGNGGLKWEDVGPIMYQKLCSLPIDIEIFAPYGTKKEQLKTSFLAASDRISDQKKTGREIRISNPNWLVILEVIREVNQKKHTLHVGRVIFQKVCYLLTRGGIQTGLTFQRSWYGPYSKQVEEIILAFSNSNLMSEKQVTDSSMIEISVLPEFSFRRADYSAHELEIMKSCVDLVCRFKNTHQAEMITTVIYVYDEIEKVHADVTEQEVYDGVMEWKKWWKGKMDEEVKTTIRELAMIGQIHPRPSFLSDPIQF